MFAPGILPALARERSSCGWQRRKSAASLKSRVFTAVVLLTASAKRSLWELSLCRQTRGDTGQGSLECLKRRTHPSAVQRTLVKVP